MERVIFHVDVNSAFLSWTAVYRCKVLGETEDLRELPSAVAGDKNSRQGVILAKSQAAKKFGVKTGEPIFKAQQKCPDLVLVPPDYALYVAASRHFTALLREFSPLVEQYSIDEAWVDMTGTQGLYGTPIMAAELMRKRINEELGFTVNIGISSNKLLAKMAGDFEKPNKIHTLYPSEMEKKLWVLPVRDLFMVGAATERKLHLLGIRTIGDLAKADPNILKRKLHKPGISLWHSANGRYCDTVNAQPEDNKGYGNSTTLPADVTDALSAYKILLSLCETVAMRMRRDKKSTRCLTVSLRSNEFEDFSHQMTLYNATDSTEEIFRHVCQIFDEAWDGETPLRQLGVHATRLEERTMRQYDLFSVVSAEAYERKAKLDNIVDDLREKYGEGILRRARFVGEQTVMAGGLSKERRTGITKPVV
ncbi:MAG: DNA polymerase IV [Ruminococcaceae bacterium]|nr:DNA polymerase IV [Oscillospiraceae bacterium]